jgi:phosphoglycerate dehydrogenase-like enzyme
VNIALASPYAAELRARLDDALPADAELIELPEKGRGGADAGRGQALQHVEVALGAPDYLLPWLPDLPALRWVQSTWAGIAPLVEQPRRDFQLTGVKGLFGPSMSEYVLGWTLALRRSILHYASTARWEFRRDAGLAPLRLGIAGTGSIGSEVARRCAPFFREVVGLNSDGSERPGFARCFATADRHAFAAGLDVLVLILPATPATDDLIDGELLDRLNRGAILINGGRANSLRLPDALAALESGRLSNMVLDVFDREPLADDDPLWCVPGLYITSHSAAPTSLDAIAAVFLANLSRFRAGTPLQGLVDFQRGY